MRKVLFGALSFVALCTAAFGVPVKSVVYAVDKGSGVVTELEKVVNNGNVRYFDGAGERFIKKDFNVELFDTKSVAENFSKNINPKEIVGPVKPSGTTGATAESAATAGTFKAGQALGGAIELGVGSKILGDSIMKDGEVGGTEVALGAGGGALATHGAVNMLRSSGIPIGPVTTAVAVTAGAALGAAAVGTRILTQNDCFRDNVLNMLACCHTVAGNTALSGGVLYEIGEAAHCTGSDGKPRFGYVTYCEQGGYRTDQGLKGKFLNDEWSECEESWCEGYSAPANSDMKIDTIAFWKRGGNGKTVPCWKWECAEEGMIRSGNKCVPDDSKKVAPGKPKSEPKTEPDTTCPTCKKPTCDDWNTAEQKYCCKNAKKGKHHNTTIGVCKCDDNKKWEWDAKSGTGKCVDRVEQTKKPDNEQSDEECWYTFTETVQCANGTSLRKDASIKLGSDLLGDSSCADVKSSLTKDSPALNNLIEIYCGNSGNGGKGGNAGKSDNSDADRETQKKAAEAEKMNKIKEAREKLDGFFKKVDSDRSVWKNADGSFNAVRLASDLTAGVVLGTVGGVVSGVLIKKSQVEKGFDALNCTVNGQKIADWGDEFSVGLRR